MLQVISCECGEEDCDIQGVCRRCGKRRMLPAALSEHARQVEEALEAFKNSVVEWMDKEARPGRLVEEALYPGPRPELAAVADRARPMAALEARNWECFCDASYYDMWAVRPVGENRWGHCFHVASQQEAEGLRDLLNGMLDRAGR